MVVEAVHDNGHTTVFEALARLDADVDVDYLKNGGILQTVLKKYDGIKAALKRPMIIGLFSFYFIYSLSLVSEEDFAQQLLSIGIHISALIPTIT